MGLIPGSGRSPGEGKGYPLQYSGLENSTDSIVHGVANSRTRLSDFHLRAETVPNPNPNPNPNCSKAPCPQRFSTRMSKSMTWGSDFNASSPWVRWEFSHPFSWMENWSLKHIRTWTCTKSENFKSNGQGSILLLFPPLLPSNHGVTKQQVLRKATRARLLLGLHYQSPNGTIFLQGYFHFSTIVILGQIILSCGGLSCMISDIRQYP